MKMYFTNIYEKSIFDFKQKDYFFKKAKLNNLSEFINFYLTKVLI